MQIMRILIFSFYASVILFVSCENKVERPDDAIGTGRLFIRSLLDGDFKTAKDLLYQDSSNKISFQVFKEQYESRLTEKEKAASKKSDIIIHEIENQSDSIVIIYYSSSIQKVKKPLRILKKGNEWQVDFHYTYSGNL
jgi:hypothetical protein